MLWIFKSSVFAVDCSSQSPLFRQVQKETLGQKCQILQLFKCRHFIAISNLTVIIKVRGPWTMKEIFYKRRYCFIFIEKDDLFIMCWEQSSSADGGGYRLFITIFQSMQKMNVGSWMDTKS